MVAEASSTAFAASRRTMLKMALAAFAGKFAGLPGLVAAQDAASGTWNPGGNAGQTGELPGPGLDFDGALGELWRIPRDEFGRADSFEFSGYSNGVMYLSNGKSLIARRLHDGAFVWEQSPATLAATPTPAASPQAGAETISMYRYVTIDNGIVLATSSDGHLWALDAMTGALRWDSGFGGAPIVVDHVAYGGVHGGVCAIELGDSPILRWQADANGGILEILGVEAGCVFVFNHRGDAEIRALKCDDGTEFWRTSLTELGEVDGFFGVSQDGVLLHGYDSSEHDYLVMVGGDGQVAWDISDDGYNGSYHWLMNETIARMTPTQSVYDTCRIQALFADDGQPRWDLEVNAARWSRTISEHLVLCAGKAYALVYDGTQDKNLLAVGDPVTGEVVGAWDSRAVPFFVADGVMLAQDYDTSEILAIGAVPAVLQAGGRATVTKDATVRGAPSDAAIERAQVTSGTLVDVTGDSETSNGTKWVPVTVQETGKSGWLPVDVLAGRDGPIRFSAIDVSEFGQFTTYPKKNS